VVWTATRNRSIDAKLLAGSLMRPAVLQSSTAP
jgi:hypothetical protein